ncbi:MAG: SCO family protein [Flavobacterium sp.]|nr:SCO family protein [Flavobacterium sp.]
MKNKSYIAISFVILVFGILVVPKIVERIKNNDIVQGDRLNVVTNNKSADALYLMGPAPKFELTDQNNKIVNNETYKGKVYVLEFFFATCPTICPRMNASLRTVEDLFYGNKNFGIASITINPENDTPEVLKKHAKDLGVKSENWHFLTGKKEYIYDLANKGFNIYAGKNEKIGGGFEHSGYFALIDKKGNIRCRLKEGNPIMYYEGTEKSGVNDIKEDIKILLEE